MTRKVLFCLLSLFCSVWSRKVLVILDNPVIKETHSLFLAQLTATGATADIKIAEDHTIQLKKYGVYLYTDLVLLAPTVEELGGGLTAESVVEFIDDGGNVFIAAGPETGDVIRDIASEVGIELDETGTYVIDHLNFDKKDSGLHNLVVSEPVNLVKSDRIVGSGNGPVLYRGLGMVTDPGNPLALGILSASSSAYSHNPEQPIQDYPHAVGKNTLLVAGLQARNNARVVITGSMEMLSDAFYTSKVEVGGKVGVVSGNSKLITSVLAWCFKEAGVVRIDQLKHHMVGSVDTPAFYTVKEDCLFTLKISELVNGAWVPFKADDVQMEFVRIDPFVRQRMINNNGVLTAKFKIPDVYGVFKFKIDYSRLGLSRVEESVQVSVHPLRHNQYERFIASAYPYYASAFSMMGGVFIFALVFLHNKEETKSKSE